MLNLALNDFEDLPDAPVGAFAGGCGFWALFEKERVRADEAESALERERVRADEAEALARERNWEIGRLRGRRNYWKSSFKRSNARFLDSDAENTLLKRIIARLSSSGEKQKKHRYGRRSEKKSKGKGGERKPGQQSGSKGHGRTPRDLEQREEYHDPDAEDRKCPCCGEPYVRNGYHKSRRIEIIFKAIERIIFRGRWRKNCGCEVEPDDDLDTDELEKQLAGGGSDDLSSSGASGAEGGVDPTSSTSSGDSSGSHGDETETGDLPGNGAHADDEGSGDPSASGGCEDGCGSDVSNADSEENTGPEGCDSDEEADDSVSSGSADTVGLNENDDPVPFSSAGKGSGSTGGSVDGGEATGCGEPTSSGDNDDFAASTGGSGSEGDDGRRDSATPGDSFGSDDGSLDGVENTGPEGCDSDEGANDSAPSGSADTVGLDENDDPVSSSSAGKGSGSTGGSVDNGEPTSCGEPSSSGESDDFAASTGGSGSDGDDGRRDSATPGDSSGSDDGSLDGVENTGPEGCDSDEGADDSASSGSADTVGLDENDEPVPSPSSGEGSGSTGEKVGDGGTTGTGVPASGGETDSTASSGSTGTAGSAGPGYKIPVPPFRSPAAVEIYVPPVDSLFTNTLFGISVWSQFLYLHYCRRLSLNGTANWFGDHGIPMSPGTLGDSIPRFELLFAPLIEAIAARQDEARIRYGDETSWRVQELNETKGNSKAWMWIGLSDDTVLFKISPSRSAEAAAELFGKAPAGTILVCDRYSAYKKLARECDFVLAFCWAHARRDFLECSMSDKSLEDWRQSWVDRIGEIFALNELRCAAVNQGLPCASEQLALEKAVDAFFDKAKEELDEIDEVDPRRKPLQSLLNHKDGLTVFVDNHEVELTNNRSERAIRGGVIIRKISLGSFSLKGAAFTAMMLSVFGTLERNGVAFRPWLNSWLQACADNGQKPPDDLTPWLPWKIGDKKPP